MKRCVYVSFLCALSFSVAFAESLELSTVTFGRPVEAAVIDGALHWLYPADGLARGGEGKIDWKGVSITDISAMERIVLPGDISGLAVAGTDGSGLSALYVLKDVWGGLELTSPVPTFVASAGERIMSSAFYQNLSDSSSVTIIATDLRLVANTEKDGVLRSDESALLPSSSVRVVVNPDVSSSSNGVLVLTAQQANTGWAASLWSLGDGFLVPLGAQSAVTGETEPLSFTFSQSGSERSVLMLGSSGAIQWSWSGNVPVGGSFLPLGSKPDAFIWHGVGKKAIFLTKTETGFTGMITPQSGCAPLVPWKIAVSGVIEHSGKIMQKGDGFRLWCVAADDGSSIVYSLEISTYGEVSVIPYGAIAGGSLGATIAWSDGAWILSSGNGGVWKLNDIERRLEPYSSEHTPFSITEVEEY